MENYFSNYRQAILINQHVDHPRIIVGDHSIYAGFYSGMPFEHCVKFLDDEDRDVEGDRLIIGKFCEVGSGVAFMMAGNQGHRSDWISMHPLNEFENTVHKHPPGLIYRGDMIIGNDVYIGHEALIMSGVQIGDGAIIGARSVVTKNVEPYTIVGGNPARLIRKRFTDDQIALLLKIKWWDWDEEKIKNNLSILRSGDIEKLSKI